MRSSNGAPPQSPLIDSTNFCPYPVEPWKLIMMTTYPLAAKSSGFQRKLQSSPQAPCGPPWMRNFTGYFLLRLLASKLGGLSRKPSTLSPFAPVNENDSNARRETWESTESFICVSGLLINRTYFGSGFLADDPAFANGSNHT